MDLNSLTDFVRPELLILVPVLYLIGIGLKGAPAFANKHIPLMLGLIGIALAIVETLAVSSISGYQDALSAVFTAITQGITCAGCAVYAHQIAKQYKKTEDAAPAQDSTKAA